MSDTSHPASLETQAVVNLGSLQIDATQFTLYSGEARMHLAALNEEFETLTQHGVVTDGLMQAASSLAEISAETRIVVLADLVAALARALLALCLDPVSEGEIALLHEAVEEVDRRVMQTLQFEEPSADMELIQRLDRLAAGTAPLPQAFAAAPAAVAHVPFTGMPAAQREGPAAARDSAMAGAPRRRVETPDPPGGASAPQADGAPPAASTDTLRGQLRELQGLADAVVQSHLVQEHPDSADPAAQNVSADGIAALRRMRVLVKEMTESLDEVQAVQLRLSRALDEALPILERAHRLASQSARS